MSKAYWVFPDGEIIDIKLETHISYIINNPSKFNTTIEKITELYKKYDEIIPVEGLARKSIIMDLLVQGYIRIRQYHNHWSVSINQLDRQSKSSLSKWAELAMIIPNSGKYADVIIQTYGGKKHHYSVQDLYSPTI